MNNKVDILFFTADIIYNFINNTHIHILRNNCQSLITYNIKHNFMSQKGKNNKLSI